MSKVGTRAGARLRRLMSGGALGALLVAAAPMMSAVPVLGPVLGAAQAQAVDSLEDALIAAYSSNPTLLAQRAALRATDENVNQAISGWRPNVQARGSYDWTDSETESNTFNSDTTTETLSASVTATQNLFTGFQTLNTVREQRANVRAARGQLASVEQQVLLDTVTAYMDVLRDRAVVRLSENNVQVLRRQREAATDRFRVGEITRTDVAQAEARLSSAESNLIASEAQLTASRSSFERQIGTAPGTLQPPPPLPGLPESEAAALQVARANNPTLISAREAEDGSRHAVSAAKGALLPTVQVQAGYSYSDREGDDNAALFNDSSSETTATSVTGTVSMPLYASGANYSRIRQAKQLNSQDRLQIAEAERSVTEAVANSWEALRSARARIAASREAVRANEIAFEGVQQEAQVGSRTTLDVLDAEQELLDSRVALVRAERDEYVAAFQLLSAVGQLQAQAIGLPVDIYDPEDHYNDVSGKWIGFGERVDD